MANPAYELLEILEAWKHGNGLTAQQARARYAQGRGESESAVIRRVMACIVDIEELINERRAAGEDVASLDYALPLWQTDALHAIAAVTQQVVHNRAVDAAPVDHLMHLRTFGSRLEREGGALAPRPEAIAALDGALEDAVAFIEDADLADSDRRYLLALLESTRGALHAGRPLAFRKALSEFLGAALLVERTMPEERRNSWTKLREQLLYPTLAGAAGNLLAQALIVAPSLLGR